ncbi:hypothetical protein Pstu01_33010 [Stutzerimonas stutzeri]|nr:hypothetical protein Pstu01_33010 [Stutzerimonas stutzeri]
MDAQADLGGTAQVPPSPELGLQQIGGTIDCGQLVAVYGCKPLGTCEIRGEKRVTSIGDASQQEANAQARTEH